MVTAISLARKRGDDQSPNSLTDFVSHSIGRLVWGISSPSRSRALSLGARALFSWSRAVPSTFISIFRLNSFTSYRLLSEDWGLFQIYVPLSDHTADWDLVCLNPLSDHTADWGSLVIYPLFNWLRKPRYCKRPWISLSLIYLWR